MSFSIIGTGSALPTCVKTNDDLANIVDTNDEWISQRTGIKERHVCVDESLSDLAFMAATNALENANIKAEELDLIVCATIRGEYISPSLACIVQGKIGANCPAFDVNAACSGFIYALDVAVGYFARGRAKKVLVIAAEAMSKLVDWNDRATCVLFGDGAGAVVLSSGEDLLSIKLSAKGDTDLITIPHVQGNSPFNNKVQEQPFLYMSGQEVYRFAVSSICNDIASVIDEAGLTMQDVDYIVPHQANLRIIDAAQKRLNISSDKFIINIDRCGNTSSASIPLLLDECNRNGKFKKGDILAMSAFGGGLTTSACVIRWAK